MRFVRFVCPLAALLIAAVLTFTPAVRAQSSMLVIATGLDNPRGLNFGPDGALYVVEAGRGGDSALCLPQAENPTEDRCYGPTGAITRITGINQHQRVVTGLPSLAGPDGSAATGPHDIGFGFGSGWVTIGLGADPAVRAPFEAAGAHFGWLMHISPSGVATPILDISAYEAAANPDGREIDSNPYGLQILPDRALIADAGANAVLQVLPTGAISSLSVLPFRTVPNPLGGPDVEMQPVPTSVLSIGSNVFVGQLTGFPFPAGEASVHMFPMSGGDAQPVLGGFTNIIDIAFDPRSGAGYILEHDSDGLLPPTGPGDSGRLVRFNPDGSLTEIPTPGLIKPGGVAVGSDGAVYVTHNSIFAGAGEVWRIVP
jgi:hypothetical protein